MSLWHDFLGAEIRFVQTKHFGRIRIAEAGDPARPTILFMHGIGGHLEAYAKNLVPLSDQFHCVALDYVGHGLSERQEREYTPPMLADQIAELMDALGLDTAHLSGESLGGWTSGYFALNHSDRLDKLMMNTAAGIPIVSEKGQEDLANLKRLSKANADKPPTFESVKARMEWLFHPDNYSLITDELVNCRLRYYQDPANKKVAPMVNQMLPRHDEFLIELEKIQAPTMLLWTRDNPIHDLEVAKAAHARMPGSELYVMEANSCHWPQFEAPEEFNAVCRRFFAS